MRSIDDDENRQDFEQLKRQLSRSQSVSPSSSTTSTLYSNSTTAADAELWPLQLNPQLIDHYIFGEIIGNGSYADVRECIDTRTLERLAVKIVNKQYLRRQNPAALLNQREEIRLLRRLRHPNIIAMRECLLRGPKIYIILEHCTFVLSDLLSGQPDKRLTISLARNLFHQLITGIHYLHSIGVVHRDIKPQNLLITTCGVLKIIDFGVSQLLSIWSQQDLCTNYEGSPLFQAPEVVSSQPTYQGFKVDVWSAGVTLYLMLFGQYPFMDESLLGLYDKILAEEFVVPPGTCSIVEDLLGMVLDKDSAERATTEMILDHPWLKFRDATHDDDNDDDGCDPHSEFIELTQQLQTSDENYLAAPGRSDVYKSMSVLPYLHSYHFPHLPTIKARQQQPDQLPGASSDSSSNTTATGSSSSAASSRASSPASPVANTPSDTASNPHEMIADQPVEWGTEGQYNLLKVPLIRANRLRHKTRRRRSRRNRRLPKVNNGQQNHRRSK